MYQNNTKATEKIAESTFGITQVAYNSVNNLLEPVVAQLPYVISGILFILFFWLPAKVLKAIYPKTSKKTNDEIATEIKDSLNQEDIELYPLKTAVLRA